MPDAAVMTAAERHPDAGRLDDEKLAALLEGRDPSLRAVYLAIHRLMIETLPDVDYSTDLVDPVTGYGARQYGYDGWGMAALAAPSRWVSLMFMRGAELSDPGGILEGTGKQMRHVKVRSPGQLAERREAIRALILAAARVHT